MKLTLTTGVSSLVLGMLAASAASAADLTEPAVVPVTEPGIVGYVDLHGGGEADIWAFEGQDTNTYTYGIIGGAGRGVVDISPTVSTQLDAWFETYTEGNGNGAGTSSDSGIADHLTWHPSQQDSIGVLGSIGASAYWDGLFGNAGVEAARDFGGWRLYGQAGIAHGLTGRAADLDTNDLYATLNADFFVNPNLMVSGNIGGDHFTVNTGYDGLEVSFGGKLEFKPDTSPVSLYVAYEGYAWAETHDGAAYDHGLDHTIFAGIRIPLGTDSLQTLQNRVGLSDMNPMFGDSINR